MFRLRSIWAAGSRDWCRELFEISNSLIRNGAHLIFTSGAYVCGSKKTRLTRGVFSFL